MYFIAKTKSHKKVKAEEEISHGFDSSIFTVTMEEFNMYFLPNWLQRVTKTRNGKARLVLLTHYSEQIFCLRFGGIFFT